MNDDSVMFQFIPERDVPVQEMIQFIPLRYISAHTVRDDDSVMFQFIQ